MVPRDEESRQVMARLEAALANSRRLGEIHDFVDKCNSDFQLNDAALTQNLQLLHRALGRGAFQEAEECARSVQGQLEAGLRKQWQLGEHDDLWGRAAHWASVRGLPEAANDWFVDESDQDGSPGSAVPRRPRPPISVADRH